MYGLFASPNFEWMDGWIDDLQCHRLKRMEDGWMNGWMNDCNGGWLNKWIICSKLKVIKTNKFTFIPCKIWNGWMNRCMDDWIKCKVESRTIMGSLAVPQCSHSTEWFLITKSSKL